jgi:hypothetical protein
MSPPDLEGVGVSELLPEPEFLNYSGAQKSIPGINSSCSRAGRYDNPIPTRFLAPIDCFKKKISSTVMNFWKGRDMFLCLYLVTAHAVGRWYPTLVCAHAEKKNSLLYDILYTASFKKEFLQKIN